MQILPIRTDVYSYADAVKRDSLQKAGCDQVEICETPGFPIVYGEKIIDPNLPTDFGIWSL